MLMALLMLSGTIWTTVAKAQENEGSSPAIITGDDDTQNENNTTTTEPEDDAVITAEPEPGQPAESSAPAGQGQNADVPPAPAGKGMPAMAPPAPTNNKYGKILINRFLINQQGQSINEKGELLSGDEKYIFEKYYHTGDDGSIDLDVGAPIELDGSKFDFDGTYQLEPTHSNPNPYNEITLSQTNPEIDVFHAYTARHSFKIMVLPIGGAAYVDEPLKLDGGGTATALTVFTGNTINIKSTLADSAKALNLPVTKELKGWAYSKENAENGICDIALNADLLMPNKSVTLYAVIGGADIPTARIKIIPYLMNAAQQPIDNKGNVVSSFEDALLFPEHEFYFEDSSGNIDLPAGIGNSYTVENYILSKPAIRDVNIGTATMDSSQIRFLTTARNGKEDISFLPYSRVVKNLQVPAQGEEGLTLYCGYKTSYVTNFNVNLPSDIFSGEQLFDATYVLKNGRYYSSTNIEDTKVYLSKAYGSTGSSDFANEALSKVLGSTDLKGLVHIGWSTNPESTGEGDPNFYAADREYFLQPAHDVTLYAIWSIEVPFEVEAYAYRVNADGQAIDANGQVIPYDSSNPADFYNRVVLLPDPIKAVIFRGNVQTNTMYPGVYHQISAATSLGSDPMKFEFSYKAFQNGHGGQPKTQLVKVTGTKNDYKLWNENDEEIKLYYGYTGPYNLTYHTNYPAGANKSNISKTSLVQEGKSNIIPKWKEIGFSDADMPEDYILVGWSENPNATIPDIVRSEHLEKGISSVNQSFDMPGHDLELHGVWVPVNGAPKINYYPILGKGDKPVGSTGTTLYPGTSFVNNKVLLENTDFDTYRKDSVGFAKGSEYRLSHDVEMPLYIEANGLKYKKIPGYLDSNGNPLYRNTSPMITWFMPDSGIKEVYICYAPVYDLKVYANYPSDVQLAPGATTKLEDVFSYGDVISNAQYGGVINWLQTDISGYEFLGFSLKPSDPDNIYSVNSPLKFQMPENNLTLYGQWKKISSDPSKGTIMVVNYYVNNEGKALDEQELVVDDYKSAKILSTYQYSDKGSFDLNVNGLYYVWARNFTMDGTRYLYEPDSISESSGSNGTKDAFGVSLLENKNTTLYFGYSGNSAYKLNYDANLPADLNADEKAALQTPQFDNQLFAAGEEVLEELADYPATMIPSSVMYVFAGWSTSPDGSEPIYRRPKNDETNLTPYTMPTQGGDATLYAVWKQAYKVTYKLDADFHGSIPGAVNGELVIKIGPGTDITKLPKPTVNCDIGYQFAYWQEANGQKLNDMTGIVDRNLTFTGFDEINENEWFNIVFKPGVGGVLSGADADGNYTLRMVQGTLLSSVTPPAVTSDERLYKFSGWSPAYDTGHALIADLTFVAQYDRTGYKLTYAPNLPHDFILSDVQKQDFEAPIFTKDIFTPGTNATADLAYYSDEAMAWELNYWFAGWSDGETDTVYRKDGSDSFIMPEKDLVLSGVWKQSFTVSYKMADGAHGSITSPNSGSEFVINNVSGWQLISGLGEPDTTWQKGYQFGGWRLAGTSTMKDDLTGYVSSSLIFEALEEINPEDWAHITFNSSDTTLGTIDSANAGGDVIRSVIKGTKLSEVIQPSVSIVDERYVFNGWAPDFDLDFEVEEDLAFSAQFLQTKFNLDYVINLPGDLQADNDVLDALNNPTIPKGLFEENEDVKENLAYYPDSAVPDDLGYWFAGWSTDPVWNGEESSLYNKDENGFLMPDEGKTLYGVWRQSYTITYKMAPGSHGTINGAAANGEYVIEKVSGKKLIEELSDPAVDFDAGYRLAFWLEPQSNSKKSDMSGAVSESLVFVAYEEKIPGQWFNVSFEPGEHGSLAGAGNDGRVVYELLVGTQLGSAISPPAVNANSGYSFSGWYPVFNGSALLSGNTTFVAQYEALPPPVEPTPTPVAPVGPTPAPTPAATPTAAPTALPTIAPTVEPEATPAPTPAAPVATTRPPANEEEEDDGLQAVLDINSNPEDGRANIENIGDGRIPLGMMSGNYWSLLNLLMALTSVLIAVAMVIARVMSKGGNNTNSSNQDGKAKRRGSLRVISVIAGFIPAILFLVLENTRLPMAWISKWTPLVAAFFILFCAFFIIFIAAKKKEEESAPVQEGNELPDN